MTVQHPPTHNAELHVELLEIVRQYSTGLITDTELLESCKTLQDLYRQLDRSELCDPNAGLRLAQMEPTDLRGIPFYNKETGEMCWAEPVRLPPST